ncbi:MAG TPA: PEP/pyruvate-binding domain-containing protein [Kofleriaceae bacterium]|nr:PEP/pyruvate-binding domain-containing protein [Kofleriaceae bacterium]
MRPSLRLVSFIVLGALAGCAAGDADEDWGPEWSDGKADSQQSLYYKRIVSKSQFTGMALANGGLVIQGPSMKFVIDRRNQTKPVVYFQNANYTEHGKTPESAKYHFYFSEAVLPDFAEDLESFNAATYSTQDKKYVAGTIQTYRVDPDGEPLYGFQFYPEDVAAEGTIADAMTAVKKAFQIPGAKLAFVATGPQQTTATIGDKLAALGMRNTTVDQILGSLNYLPLNLGEAWGYLRIFPGNADDLTPLDIAVLDDLPLDLAVVAGTITRAYQDASSHVNLKSKERGTPDMVLRDAGPSQAQLAPLANQPVHLVVKADSFVIEPTTDELVRQKFEERTNRPWIPVEYVPETRLLSFAEMCPGSASDCIAAQKRFGSKAANLGLLQHRSVLGKTTDAGSTSQRFGYDLSPPGLGVPVTYYHDFVSYAPNTELRAKLSALIAAEKTGTLSPAQRRAMADDTRLAFYRAQVPPEMLSAIRTKVGAVLPGVDRIKIRSSANAEDLPNFDGAGLHDSFSARMSSVDNPDGSCQVLASTDGVDTKLEVSPKTVNCALKGVWASLWNKRAIEERSFARLDHATVGMGIAIVSRYDDEFEVVANSVLVTRVIGNSGIYGYSFSTQVGNNLVTNPAPGTYAENVIAGFVDPDRPPTFTVTRYATPDRGAAPLTHRVLADDQMTQMLDITRHVEAAYCSVKPGYYSGSCDDVSLDPEKPTALDLEVKILDNGHYVFKQVREFAGH